MRRGLVTSVRVREVLVLQGTPAAALLLSLDRARSPDLASAALVGLASLLLVAAIWTFNDWADFSADRADASRRPSASRGALLGQSAALLAASAAPCAFLPAPTRALAALIAVLGVAYSARAKGIPVAGSLLHLIGGLAHFLMASSVWVPVDARSVELGLFFALVFTAGHGIQEVQDHAADLRAGVRTNAVAFGARPVFLAACALFGAAYADLLGLCAAGLFPAPVAAVALVALPLQLAWSRGVLAGGLAAGDVARLRDRYRALFALIGLAMAAGTLFHSR